MPTYAFICDKCPHRYELDMMMSEIGSYKPKCPLCKKKARQDYSNVSVFGPNKTLGSLADKNTSIMSEEQKKHIYDKNNEYKKKPYTGPMPEGGYIRDSGD